MKLIRILWAMTLALPLSAQQPDTGARHEMHVGGGVGMEGMMGHMQMMAPMMRVMVFHPGHLLMHRDVLNLTEQQVAKLTALRDAAKGAEDAARTDVQTHEQALAAVLASSNPDTTRLKSHFQAMQAATAKGHWAMLSAAAQARAALTDTQRARADGWADGMEHMMPMMDRGMWQKRDSIPH